MHKSSHCRIIFGEDLASYLLPAFAVVLLLSLSTGGRPQRSLIPGDDQLANPYDDFVDSKDFEDRTSSIIPSGDTDKEATEAAAQKKPNEPGEMYERFLELLTNIQKETLQLRDRAVKDLADKNRAEGHMTKESVEAHFKENLDRTQIYIDWFAKMGEKEFVERWTLNRRAGWVDSNYYDWVQESITQLWYSYVWYVEKYVEVLGVNWDREAKDIRKEYDEEIQKAEQKYKEATLENFYARCAKTSPYYETYILPKENKKREDYLLRYRATEEMLIEAHKHLVSDRGKWDDFASNDGYHIQPLNDQAVRPDPQDPQKLVFPLELSRRSSADTNCMLDVYKRLEAMGLESDRTLRLRYPEVVDAYGRLVMKGFRADSTTAGTSGSATAVSVDGGP